MTTATGTGETGVRDGLPGEWGLPDTVPHAAGDRVHSPPGMYRRAEGADGARGSNRHRRRVTDEPRTTLPQPANER